MKKTNTLLLMLLLYTYALQATSLFSFKSYQIEDGLSHNTVWCALQDSYGFMWFGTSDGLNRYSGQANKIYRNELNNKYSIENNYIQTLFELENSDLLIGTNRGIYIYDRKSEYFTYLDKLTKYNVSISSSVKKIIRTHSGLLWIATMGQGFFIYDPVKDELRQNSLYTSFVCDICQKDSGKIYVASLQQGLYCFDEEGNFLQQFNLKPGQEEKEEYKINCLMADKNALWIGVSGNQLLKLYENTGKINQYTIADHGLESIQCLLEYDNERILVGTDDGLYLLNHKDGTVTRVDNPNSLKGISDPSVNAMSKDKEGGIWILTNLGGVNYIAKSGKQFYSFKPENEKGATKVTGPFCEDGFGNIWIGTRKGLCSFNTEELTLNYHPIGRDNDKKYDIRSLLIEGNKLWIGTYGNGVFRMDIETKDTKHYSHSQDTPNTICGDEVLSIYKERNGNIYVGTSWGLSMYDRNQDNFNTITAVGMMVSVVDIQEDIFDNLWIATSNSGVFRLNLARGEWRHFQHEANNPKSILSNSIISLFQDSRGQMWFGTDGRGLCSFNPTDETFTDFDPDNNLIPNKVIYSIEEDGVGNFWISSNAGLLKINPLSKNNLRRFTVEDGLLSNQFNSRSSFKSSENWMFFGGIQGFNTFLPETFTDNKYVPAVYITDINFPYLDETKEKAFLSDGIPIYMASHIRIPYQHNSFTINFASLSYEAPDNNRYSHRLGGVDKDWINDKTSNTASYTDLPPGKYVFEVKGSNNDNIWNEQATTLIITILPPWWRTTVAYIIYFLLLAGGVYYLAWRWNQYIKYKYNRQLKKYKADKEKEIYQSKINFFINLVHEIRTPLSLIKLPLEKLQGEKDEDKKEKYLSAIDRNVNYLLDTTNQLLDFQKMESGNIGYRLKPCNFNQLVGKVCHQFTTPAEVKGINLITSFPDKDILSDTDADKVSKILVNLINNAIKYAKQTIEVRLYTENDSLYISVSDDGPGIPVNKRERVFEAFYQIEEGTKGGTGIGLAFSKSLAEGLKGSLSICDSKWGGSEFVLDLPILETELKEERENMSEAVVKQSENDSKEIQFSFPARKYTILLVEDNVELLNFIEDSLKEWFRILKAHDGSEALNILSNENPDLVVSDVMMDGMDGMELCRRIKTDINYSHIPVLLLTAKTTLEAKTEGLENGADTYMEKPFTIRQLHAQIENLIKLRISYHKLMSSLSKGHITEMPNSLSHKDVQLMEKIKKAVEEQLSDENFSIDNLAETMHMSRSNFYRKLKALSGMPPNDYLRELRLTRAAELLSQGERVTDVYHQVGFNSSSYFAKCFKTKFGVVPKDWGKGVSVEV